MGKKTAQKIAIIFSIIMVFQSIPMNVFATEMLEMSNNAVVNSVQLDQMNEELNLLRKQHEMQEEINLHENAISKQIENPMVNPVVEFSESSTNAIEPVVLERTSTASIVNSGKWHGVDWSLDSDGFLLVTGSATESFGKDTYSTDVPWYKKQVLSAKVDAKGVTNTSYWFYNQTKLSSIDFSGFDTSRVTDMCSMFSGCGSLTGLDVSGFNTSRVTDMCSMFSSCGSLTGLDVSGFNTSQVTDMGYMFRGCGSLTGLDVSGFNTSQVADMCSMFSGCERLTGLDVSGFNTSRVKDIQWMFNDCASLTSLDVSGFNTSQVPDMSFMFDGCGSLTGLDVSGFNTSRVTNMGYMFRGCGSLTGLDVSGFNTSQVTDMGSMFSGCERLTGLDVSGFDTSRVIEMSYMFHDCERLTSLDVSEFDTSIVQDMVGMFGNCASLTSLDLSGFDRNRVTTMNWMFSDCASLTSLDLSGFATSEVTSMEYMFDGCASLTSLDLSGFDTSRVTSMSSMFDGCASLTSLDLSGFDTSEVTSMEYMFSDCASLTSLDLSGFDTSIVQDMKGMFVSCKDLTSLDLSSFDMKKVVDAGYMLGYNIYVPALISIKAPKNLSISVDLPCPMYDSMGTKYTKLPKLSYSILLTKDKLANTIPEGAYHFKVVDSYNKPLSGVKVKIDSFEKTTNANGYAEFTDTFGCGVHELLVSKDNSNMYHDSDYVINPFSYDIVKVKLTGADAGVCTGLSKAIFQLNGVNTDLLTKKKTINKKYSTTKFNLIVSGNSDVQKYKLYSGDEEIAENDDGKFTDLRYHRFSADQDVVVKYLDKNSQVWKEEVLQLKVIYDASIPASISIGDGISYTIAPKEPLVGGMEIKMDFYKLPIFTECDDTGIYKIGVGNIGDFTDSLNWYDELKKMDSKTFGQLLRKGIVEKRSSAKFVEKPWKTNAIGYLEGSKEKLTGKFLIEIEPSAYNGTQCFIGNVPVVVEAKVEGKLTAEGAVVFNIVESNILSGSLVIDDEFKLGAYAGVGIAKLASTGLYGSCALGIKMGLIPIETQRINELYLEGKIGLKAKLLGKDLGHTELLNEKRYIVRNDTNTTDNVALEPININYDKVYADLSAEGPKISAFSEPVSFHAQGSLDQAVLQDSAYMDLNPKIVTTKDTTMLCYLSDAGEGLGEGNRSTLVYSIYNSDGTWSPIQTVEEDQTADFSPDIFSDGEDIYLVWQDGKEALQSDMTLNQIADALNLTVAKFNKETQTFDILGTIESTNGLFEQTPQIAGVGEEAYVFWNENATDNVLGLTGSNSLYRAKITIQEEPTLGTESEYSTETENTTESGNTTESENTTESVNTTQLENSVLTVQNIEPQVLGVENNTILSSDAGLINDEILFTYAEGTMDADYTVTASNICSYNQAKEKKVIEARKGTNTIFYNFFGETLLTWYDQGTIHYLSKDGTASELLGEGVVPSTSYTILEDVSGNPSIIYPCNIGGKADLYQLPYDAETGFVAPIQLTNHSDYIQNVTGIKKNNEWILVYNQMQVDENLEEKKNTLSSLIIPQVYSDLVVSNPYYITKWNAELEKDELQIGANLNNNGTSKLENMALELKSEGGEVLETKILPWTLEVGEQVEILEAFSLDKIAQKGNYTIEVKTGVQERITENNQVPLLIGESRLEVDTQTYYIGDFRTLKVSVKNVGKEATSGTIRILDADTNEERFTTKFGEIAAGGIAYKEYTYKGSSFEGKDSISLKIEVEPTIPQENTSVLSDYAVVSAPLYTMTFVEDTDTEPVYIRGIPYGTKIDMPVKPSKEGYRFVGWCTSKDGVTGEFMTRDSIITQSKTVYAIFREDLTFEPAYMITLDADKLELGVLEKKKLHATIYPQKGIVSYTSSDTNVATVSSNGEIIGTSEGVATITAKVGNASAKCYVLVTSETMDELKEDAIQIDFSQNQINKGSSTTFRVTKGGNNLDLSACEYAFIDEQMNELTTEEDDETGATTVLGEDGKEVLRIHEGTLFALGNSSTKKLYLKAMYTKDDQKILQTKSLFTIKIPVQKIQISDPVVYNMQVQDVLDLSNKLVVLPTNADDISANSITWKSLDQEIVQVSQDGKVKAMKAGRASIEVEAENGLRDFVTIVVERPNTPDFTIPSQATLYINGVNEEISEGVTNPKSIQLTPTPEEGMVLHWSSSNEQIATVSQNGVVTAVGVNDKTQDGSAVITGVDAAGSGKYATCLITTKKQVTQICTDADSVIQSKGKLILQKGKTFNLNASVIPKDASHQSLHYVSSKESVAKVSTTGKINALSTGVAEISILQQESGEKIIIPVLVVEGVTQITSKIVITGADTNALEPKEEVSLSANCYNQEGTLLPEQAVMFKSQNDKVATVTSDGTVKAIAKGTTFITATACDGSNVVEQRDVVVTGPVEALTLNKDMLFLQPGKEATIKPVFSPSNTDDQRVTYRIQGEDAESGDIVVSQDGFVTVKATALNGMHATITVTSAADPTKTATCEVVVVNRLITDVKFTDKTIDVSGIGTKDQLEVLVKPADSTACEEGIEWKSLDENVVVLAQNKSAVSNGATSNTITTTGFGQTTIVAMSADGAKQASCKISVYPLDKRYKLSSVTSTQKIEIFSQDQDSHCVMNIKNQFGKTLDPSLFTYVSSNERIVNVDELGCVTPNPMYAKAGKATITAFLKSDPAKRKVKMTVQVLAVEQVDRIEIQMRQKDGSYVETKTHEFAYQKGDQLTFRAVAYNSNATVMSSKVKWTLSDKMGTLKANDDGTITLTVQKAGRFALICTAKDTFKRKTQVSIKALSGEPKLVTSKVSTNQKQESDQSSSFEIIASDASEILVGGDSESRVTSVKKGLSTLSNEEIAHFKIVQNPDNTYAIRIDNAYRKTMSKGTYQLKLSIVSDEIDSLLEENGTRHTNTVDLKLEVISKEPTIKINNPSINLFDLSPQKRRCVLVVSAPNQVELVEIVDNQKNAFEQYFLVQETDDNQYEVVFRNNAKYKLSSLTGMIRIKIKGYDEVEKSIKVLTPSTAPKRTVSKVVVLDAQSQESAYVNILDAKTKKKTSDYKVVSNSESKLSVSKQLDGRLQVGLANGVSVKDGTKLVATLQLNNASKTLKSTIPVQLSVIVKNSAPKIKAKQSTLTLNLNAKKESAQTTVIADRDNLEFLGSKSWSVDCYDAKTKTYNPTDDFVISYQKANALLEVSLSQNSVIGVGSYKLRVGSMVEGYEQEQYPLITVNVIQKPITAKIKTTGTIDLLSRAGKSIKATIAVSNAQTRVVGVKMDSVDYYPVLNSDTSFEIRLKETASVQTGPQVIPVELTLEGGTILHTTVKVSIVQSVPKVTIPNAFRIYKSGTTQTKSYVLSVPKGVEIAKIEPTTVPDGIGVTVDENVVYVQLSNATMKAGLYKIKVNTYFKGAEPVFGYPEGKPVTSTIPIVIN